MKGVGESLGGGVPHSRGRGRWEVGITDLKYHPGAPGACSLEDAAAKSFDFHLRRRIRGQRYMLTENGDLGGGGMFLEVLIKVTQS